MTWTTMLIIWGLAGFPVSSMLPKIKSDRQAWEQLFVMGPFAWIAFVALSIPKVLKAANKWLKDTK